MLPIAQLKSGMSLRAVISTVHAVATPFSSIPRVRRHCGLRATPPLSVDALRVTSKLYLNAAQVIEGLTSQWLSS